LAAFVHGSDGTFASRVDGYDGVMDDATLNAITDAESLRTLVREQMAVIAQHAAVIAQRDRTIHARDLKIDLLTHELARLRRVHFSAKTEAMDAVQRGLFDE